MKKDYNKFLFPLIVLIMSFSIYMKWFSQPAGLFWDENYHIPSAQKYLDWSFFMEPHPPLGKLLIAAWEKIFHPNDWLTKQYYDNDQRKFIQFNETDYIKDVPYCNDSSKKYQSLPECQKTKTTKKVVENWKVVSKTSYKEFSFFGYRFFPTLFWMLWAVLIYFIFLLISKNYLIALMFSGLYIFDNALVLQSRSAMLDSTQIFFVLWAILFFVFWVEKIWKYYEKNIEHNYQNQKKFERYSWIAFLWLWIFIWLWIATKVNWAIAYILLLALILWWGYNLWENKKLVLQDFAKSLLIWVLLAWASFFIIRLVSDLDTKINILVSLFILIIGFCICFFNLTNNKIGFSNLLIKSVVSFLVSILVFSLVRIIHINIGRNITNWYYQADDFYKQFLVQSWSENSKISIPVSAYPSLIGEHLDYISHYNKWVPSLDICKEWENWSFPLNWIVWKKPINYRRSTNDSYKTVNYLYLQSNPAIWWSVALSVILAIGLLASILIFWNKNIQHKKLFYIATFLSCYILYMITMLFITRVMYLYHYLLALIFGIMVLFLMMNYNIKKYEQKHYIAFGAFITLVMVMFFFFAPFTYYKPLSQEQFQSRNFFPYWWLKAVWK